jgi:hypothetical protein
LWGRFVQRTNSMAMREPAIIASCVLGVVGATACANHHQPRPLPVVDETTRAVSHFLFHFFFLSFVLLLLRPLGLVGCADDVGQAPSGPSTVLYGLLWKLRVVAFLLVDPTRSPCVALYRTVEFERIDAERNAGTGGTQHSHAKE